MTDRNLREIASRCEAKLHGLRRTAEGAVISFVIHPNEIPRALMLDPLGTRYMLAFCAISDDEQPIPADAANPTSPLPAASDVAPDRGINRGNHSDDHRAEYRKYTDRGSAQAATAKARYAAMTAGEQAVQRAGMLPQDERFRAWATERLNASPSGDRYHDDMISETRAAEYIRHIVCGGASRARIAEDPEAMDKFIDLETRFKIAVGELPEPR